MLPLQCNLHRSYTPHHTSLAGLEASLKLLVWECNRVAFAIHLSFRWQFSSVSRDVWCYSFSRFVGEVWLRKVKKKVVQVITWHYVNETERDLACDWREGSGVLVVSCILYVSPSIRVITSEFMVDEGYWRVEKCIRNVGIVGDWGGDGSKWILKKMDVCV